MEIYTKLRKEKKGPGFGNIFIVMMLWNKEMTKVYIFQSLYILLNL